MTTSRVLVVNDDCRLVTSVQELLTSEGYAVRAVANGADALELLTSWPADLVLLDLHMPGLDGRDFLKKECRASVPARKAPIIVVWSAADHEELEQARRLGASEVLSVASTTPTNLLATIARLLRDREGA